MSDKPAQAGDFILVGEVDAGKTSLLMKLIGMEGEATKTQAIGHFKNNIIDTPGEYISRRSYYGPLLTALIDVKTILYVQPANSRQMCMPVDLLHVYANKKVVGVITKIDRDDADVAFSSKLLENNGIKDIHLISIEDDNTIAELKTYLTQ